jgi:two-component system, NtrC family, sensor kinase
VQIALDLACLTLLALWTGGIESPLLGLFVLHMVFGSLLLPPAVSYGVAVAAVGMLLLGLIATGQWLESAGSALIAGGWTATLLLTVFLTSHITARLRREEAASHALNDELQRQQRVMVQQEKMAAMGTMAAGVAHEISSPIAAMDAALQLARRQPDRITADTIDTLRGQVERIARIVRELTTFAHPDGADWTNGSVSDVVRNAMDMIRFDDRFRRVAVRCECREDVGEVRLMPQALQQVVVNLVQNALDAVEDAAEPAVTVRTRREGDRAVIEVEDNGRGISPEHRDRVFEPFFTTKPLGKGTGLGLSISYKIVKQHHGCCRYASTPGRGTVFTVSLPLAPRG